MTFRTMLLWTHLVLGLTAAAILVVVALTGAYVTFRNPIRDWLMPVPQVASAEAAADLVAIAARVDAEYAPRRVMNVIVGASDEAVVVRLRDRTTLYVHPSSMEILGSVSRLHAFVEDVGAGMIGLHTNLMLGSRGRWLVVFATLESLLLALSGIWLWWRKKQWRFAWKGSVFRISWDLHSASGIWFLIPVVAMALTGAALAFPGPIYDWAGVRSAPWVFAPAVDPPDGFESMSPIAPAMAAAIADSALPPGPNLGFSIPTGWGGVYGFRRATHTAYVEQFVPRIAAVHANRVQTAGDTAMIAVTRAHTGELWGVPGQVIMTIGSIMLAIMSLTGVILGWKRLVITFGSARRRAAIEDS